MIYTKNMRRLLGICVLILLWELAARLINSPLFPPISQVIPAFGRILVSGELEKHSLISLKEGLSGFLIACVLGFSIAVAMSQLRTIEIIIQPLVDLMRPVAA
jgi:NitT/TauT family transport system permease protein